MWQEKKPVYVLLTNSQPNESATVRRQNRDSTTQQVPCPSSIVAYNKFMGGVDKSDQLRHYYPVRCKTRKFYRYIFWFLSDSCSVNAFILIRNFQLVTDSTIWQVTLNNFRLKLAEGLIGPYNSRHHYSLPASVRALALNCGPAAKHRWSVKSYRTPLK